MLFYFLRCISGMFLCKEGSNTINIPKNRKKKSESLCACYTSDRVMCRKILYIILHICLDNNLN